MPETEQRPKGISVVCLDGNKDICDLLCATLNRVEGMRCEIAFADGESLLKYLQDQPMISRDLPDVIVMEWSEPRSSEMTTRMISVGWPKIKVVVFTALPMSMVAGEAVHSGAAAVVCKSDGILALIDAIKDVAGQRSPA